MATQPETRLKMKAFKLLDNLPNTWYFKTQEVSTMGIPDIIGCCNGLFFAWELKSEGKDATKLQSHILDKIETSGGFSAVVWEDNLIETGQALIGKAFSSQ